MLCRDENDVEIFDEQPRENSELENIMATATLSSRKNASNKDPNSARILDSGSKGRVHKIQTVSLKKINFGILKIVLILFVLLLGNALIQLFFFINSYPEATKLVNLMQVYCTGV